MSRLCRCCKRILLSCVKNSNVTTLWWNGQIFAFLLHYLECRMTFLRSYSDSPILSWRSSNLSHSEFSSDLTPMTEYSLIIVIIFIYCINVLYVWYHIINQSWWWWSVWCWCVSLVILIRNVDGVSVVLTVLGERLAASLKTEDKW